jgi:hypothetical protein
LPAECHLFVAETAAYASEPAGAKYRRRLALLDGLEALAASGTSDAELRTRFRAVLEAQP